MTAVVTMILCTEIFRVSMVGELVMLGEGVPTSCFEEDLFLFQGKSVALSFVIQLDGSKILERTGRGADGEKIRPRPESGGIRRLVAGSEDLTPQRRRIES